MEWVARLIRQTILRMRANHHFGHVALQSIVSSTSLHRNQETLGMGESEVCRWPDAQLVNHPLLLRLTVIAILEYSSLLSGDRERGQRKQVRWTLYQMERHTALTLLLLPSTIRYAVTEVVLSSLWTTCYSFDRRTNAQTRQIRHSR